MVHDAEHEPTTPGIEIVDNFTEEIRTGIVTATELAVKRVTRGYIITGLVAAVVSGCVAWAVAAPRPATTSVMYHRADGTTEVCDRTADSGPPHSVFTCRIDTSKGTR